MYSAFEGLNEVYNAFINEESIEGVMEEVFTAMEHIKKSKNPSLSVVHFFEVKWSMAMEWFFTNHPFSENSKLDKCINDVVQFVVKDDKYANISNLIFVDDIELWY